MPQRRQRTNAASRELHAPPQIELLQIGESLNDEVGRFVRQLRAEKQVQGLQRAPLLSQHGQEIAQSPIRERRAVRERDVLNAVGLLDEIDEEIVLAEPQPEPELLQIQGASGMLPAVLPAELHHAIPPLVDLQNRERGSVPLAAMRQRASLRHSPR